MDNPRNTAQQSRNLHLLRGGAILLGLWLVFPAGYHPSARPHVWMAKWTTTHPSRIGELSLTAQSIIESSSFQVCTHSNRTVLMRPRDAPFHTQQPHFTLQPRDFAWHHEKDCETVQQVLDAIRYGRRHWAVQDDNSVTDLVDEQVPSTFIPHQCDIPVLSSMELCNILHQFSHVIFHGDSLTRHLWGGLRTALTNDFVWNGMVDRSSLEPALRGGCDCDGQFSMRMECRSYTPDYEILRGGQEGWCPHLADEPVTPFHLEKIGKSVPTIDDTFFPDDVDCTDPNYRGMLFSVEGGLHFHVNASEYISHVLEPLFNHHVLRTCAAHGKLLLIWQSQDLQSPQVDGSFPWQDEAHRRRFDQEIDEYLDRRGVTQVARVSFLEMTRLAETFDGVHRLMDVNYFKAQYILRLADLMYKEKHFANLGNPQVRQSRFGFP